MNGALNEPQVKVIQKTLLELIHQIGNLSGYDIDVRTGEDVIYKKSLILRKQT